MNRTILKLFTKACYHGDYEPENVPKEVVEKFAELIVRECVASIPADGHRGDFGRAVEFCQQQILEHFGVEN